MTQVKNGNSQKMPYIRKMCCMCIHNCTFFSRSECGKEKKQKKGKYCVKVQKLKLNFHAVKEECQDAISSSECSILRDAGEKERNLIALECVMLANTRTAQFIKRN